MKSFVAMLLLLPAFAAAQPREIRGKVLEPGINQPVANAEVLLFVQEGGPIRLNGGWKSEPSAKTTTDFSGAFTLRVEKPGDYKVEARRPEYLSTGSREIAVGGDAVEVNLFLARPGRLTGRVVEQESGNPLANFRVTAARVSAPWGFEPGGTSAATDAAGRFSIAGLSPGDYAIEIRPQGEQEKRVLTKFTAKDVDSGERDYEHAYWPGGHGADSAMPVSVSSGAGVDIGKIIARKVPYYRVHVRIPPVACSPGDEVRVGESIVRGSAVTIHALAFAPCGKDLLVTGFSPGTYRLMLSLGEGRESASIPLTIVDRNVELIAPLVSGMVVDGVLLAAEGAKLPDPAKVKIQLHAVDRAFSAMPAGVAEDGTFRLEGVRLLDHTIFVSGLGGGYYVKEVRYNGAAVSNDVIAFQGGAMAHKLTVVVDDKPGVIIGTVTGGDRPVKGAAVIARKWPPPEIPSPNGTAAGKTDESGRFRLAGLAPGDYHVIALRTLDRATSQAEVERALAAAKKIEVTANGVQTVALEVK